MAAKRAQRRNNARTFIAQPAETNSSNSSSTTAEQDEFDKHKMERQESLKMSKQYVED